MFYCNKTDTLNTFKKVCTHYFLFAITALFTFLKSVTSNFYKEAIHILSVLVVVSKMDNLQILLHLNVLY